MSQPVPIRHFTTKVILAFAALYTIWGSTYFAIQLAGKSVPPLLMAGTRFLVAGGILLSWCRLSGTLKPGDLVRRNWLAAVVVGTGLMLIGNGGVALAVQRLPSGISAVLVALSPMWFVLFDWAQRRGRPPALPVFIGIGIGLVGVSILAFTKDDTSGKQLELVGIIINVVATLGWTFGSIWGRTAPRPQSPVTACAMQMLAGGVILVVVSSTFEPWSTVDITALPLSYWLSWSYLVVFGSLCGFTAFIWLLQHVSAAKVATYAYVNPMVALLIGVGLNNEHVSIEQLGACAIILVAVIVVTLFKDRRPALAPPPAE